MSQDEAMIVVGVDGSEASAAALDFALREGAARGVAVEAVSAWIWSSPYETFDARSFEENRAAAAETLDARVQEALARLSARPIVSQTVVHDYAGRALVSRAGQAAMLVVGSARKGVVRRTLQGSVSEYCVRHSPVPVVVVPEPDKVDHSGPAEAEVPVQVNQG
jgi:nucleotide-binding universal stress UspA family protein